MTENASCGHDSTCPDPPRDDKHPGPATSAIHRRARGPAPGGAVTADAGPAGPPRPRHEMTTEDLSRTRNQLERTLKRMTAEDPGRGALQQRLTAVHASKPVLGPSPAPRPPPGRCRLAPTTSPPVSSRAYSPTTTCTTSPAASSRCRRAPRCSPAPAWARSPARSARPAAMNIPTPPTAEPANPGRAPSLAPLPLHTWRICLGPVRSSLLAAMTLC